MIEKIGSAAALKHALPLPSGSPGAAAGQSFGELLEDLGKTARVAGNRSEGFGMQSVTRDAELVDVVTAVSNAEVTLETVMTIRDRLIQAYQEIIRTPI